MSSNQAESIDGEIRKKKRRGNGNRRIVERGKMQSAVITQTQKRQGENALVKKEPSHMANMEKNYGLI